MTKDDYMKLSKERLAELLVERDNQPIVIPSTMPDWRMSPCYYLDGWCTDPFHDCANCLRVFTWGVTETTADTDFNNKKENNP